jgi:hypothetical protein
MIADFAFIVDGMQSLPFAADTPFLNRARHVWAFVFLLFGAMLSGPASHFGHLQQKGNAYEAVLAS